MRRPVAIAATASLAGSIADAPLADAHIRRARKMMSRGAYLAARCLHDLVANVAWPAELRAEAGYFLGVGASGGSLDDVTALLDASIVSGSRSTRPDGLARLAHSIADHAFSVRAFGDRGLAACNPLLAFQLMNNFTMAHGAILEGLGGPNGALFSRGSGTTAALIEAVHAIASGDCDRAIAGGADSALHPVTRAELDREGFLARGLVPAEGAALVALEVGGTGIVVEHAAITSGDHPPDLAAELCAGVDVVAIAPWGPPAAAALTAWARERFPAARVIDISHAIGGDALAASPALAWVAAVEQLSTAAVVVGAGIDGDLGTVVLRRRS